MILGLTSFVLMCLLAIVAAGLVRRAFGPTLGWGVQVRFYRSIDLGLPHLARPGVSAVIVTFIPIGITILTKHPILGAGRFW